MANIWGAIQSTITEAYKTANSRAQAKWTEITATILNEGETTEKRLLDTGAVLIDPNTGLPLETVPVIPIGYNGDGEPVYLQFDADGKLIVSNDVPEKEIFTIIDNATFSETVTLQIDFRKYRNAILMIKTGTATGTPTLTPSVKIVDSNGNKHTYSTLTALSTATTMTPEELFFNSALTLEIELAHGGSGSFANVTAELDASS